MKPHKGTFKQWYPSECHSHGGLGYLLRGTFHGHEIFHGEHGHTSEIVALRPEINEVETLNSRYSLEEPSLVEGLKQYGLLTEEVSHGLENCTGRR